jgi:two-component system, chemotaxis family, CheB/CheR fusion protein
MTSPVRRRTPAPGQPGCPIVGVGASAGGLEAFSQLLQHLPLDTGFGFVLVQHLDPQHDSALTQLLSRTTALPVHEATHNMRVRANHVYIIPPNRSLGIARGVLKLQPRPAQPAAARSIDNFLEALARDLGARSIGVVLSGSATDGTLGLEAIKAEGGLTFAQDDSARFNSMPRNAVANGCVDQVLPPAGIARELARMARHPTLARPPPDGALVTLPLSAAAPGPAVETGAPGAGDHKSYQQILRLMRGHCGVDFSLYKNPTIERRLIRRMMLNRQDTLAHYATFLAVHPAELDTLFTEALINVTSFFRNADAYVALRQRVMLTLLQSGDESPLRVWVPGCSTGQEAYSLAMIHAEAAAQSGHVRPLQVFATDLNEENLAKARHGYYTPLLLRDVSPERRRRFFVEEAGGYRIIKPLREQVIFARHNLINDPPFSRMDLISCRNLMIYLEPDLQKKLLAAFHYALKPTGYLFLGASESIGGLDHLFNPVDKKQKLFSKQPAAAPPLAGGRSLPSLPLPKPRPNAVPVAPHGEISAEREADRITLNQFAPPGVLIDADLNILQFRGPTGDFLEPPTGKASFALLKMAREGLMLPLRTVINRAKKECSAVRQEGVAFQHNDTKRTVNLEVVPLKNLREPRYLVFFVDPARSLSRLVSDGPSLPVSPREKSRRIAVLERELAEARDYLRSVQEHQEVAHEELQAANEEGQSANEELQSLNEELETSKEELESTNEELTTVNEEMAGRNAELIRLNSDLTNLQTSAKLVVVLLGRDLGIRHFSAQAERQFGLTSSDLGRSITAVRLNLAITELASLLTQVITGARAHESEVQDLQGRWFALRVTPYLTSDHKVDGAVLMLVDIDENKQAQAELTRARAFTGTVTDAVREPLLILDGEGRVQLVNAAYLNAFGVTPAAVIGQRFFELEQRCWASPALQALLDDVFHHHRDCDNFELSRTVKKSGRRTFLLHARRLGRDAAPYESILLSFHDITEHRRTVEALRRTEVRLARHKAKLAASPTKPATRVAPGRTQGASSRKPAKP